MKRYEREKSEEAIGRLEELLEKCRLPIRVGDTANLKLNRIPRATADDIDVLDCSVYLWRNRTLPLLKGWPTDKRMKLVGQETRFRATVRIQGSE